MAPVAPPRSWLVFEKNSMVSTTITQNAVPVYAVSTSTHGGTTEVRATGTDALVARIARKELLPDTVKFPDFQGGKSMRLSKWLKRTTLADGIPAATFETSSGVCVLCIDPVHRLVLYSADRTTIIAHWQLKTDSSPMALVIAPKMQHAQAMILAAFLYEEQKMRATERNGEVQSASALYQAKYQTVNTTIM
ncbi:hypothetical protein DFH09DRAFT_1150226 [Mycena vulgaris]|nr:hypothetical protein DFH09DRAFT_1150226 [Mycena vulgaris]